MIRHLEKVHKVDCNEQKKLKKQGVDSQKQPKVTSWMKEKSQGQESSQSSQSQEEILELETRKKRDLKPTKALLHFCYSEILDLSIIQRPASRMLLANLAVLRNTTDLEEETALEELDRMYTSMEKTIKNDLKSVDNLTVTMNKFIVKNFESITLSFVSFTDKNWQFKTFLTSINSEDASTIEKLPGQFVRKLLDKFEFSGNSVQIVSADGTIAQRNIEKRGCLGDDIECILNTDMNNMQNILSGIFDKIKDVFKIIYFHGSKNKDLIERNDDKLYITSSKIRKKHLLRFKNHYFQYLL